MWHRGSNVVIGWRGVTTSRSGTRLPVGRIRSRLSAYVYGNVLTLAAVITSTSERIDNGVAAWAVLGTGFTTFLAHIFAEFIAHSATADKQPDVAARRELLHDLRDAVPILSSATIPTLALTMGWLGWLPTVWALAIAGGVIVVRIASIPLVAARVRGDAITPRILIAGLATALLAAVVVLVKILAH